MLIELKPSNRLFTWSNNQSNNLILAALDKVFASTDWDSHFPLSTVKALPRRVSVHNPCLLILDRILLLPLNIIGLRNGGEANLNFKI